MDIEKVQPEIKKYLQNVEKRIRIKEALLFGSLAEGKTSETSDVDIIVVSTDFEKLDPDERARLLYRASVGFPYDLHVFGMTPDELRDASNLTTIGKVINSKTISIH